MTVKPGYTSYDQDQGDDDWLPGDIAARVSAGDPEGLAHVIRALSARLADAAARVDDPRTVLLDLSRAADSMLAAVRQVITDEELCDPSREDIRASSLLAMDSLGDASAALYDLHSTF